MSLLVLLLVSAAIYAALQYGVIPRLEKRYKAMSLAGRIASSGTMGAAKFAAELAMVAVFVYGGFALIAIALGSTYGSNATVLGWVVKAATWAQPQLGALKGVYGKFTFAFFVCAFVFLTWRERRDALSGKTRKVFDEAEDRLNLQREADPEAWDLLAPNEAMLALDTEMQQVVHDLEKLQADDRHDERLAKLRRLNALREKRIREDYNRRLDLPAINAALAAARGNSLWDMLLSKGFAGDVKLGSKVLKRTAIALTLIAMVGLGDLAGVSALLGRRLVDLDELRVEAASRDVKQQWDKGLPPSAAQNDLTPEDQAAVQYLADQFVRAVLANPTWRAEGAGEGSRDARTVLTREAILRETSLPTEDGTQSVAFHPDLSDAERDALNQAIPVRPGVTRTGAALADAEGREVKSWFGSRWDDVKKAASDHAKRYSDPLQAMDVRQTVIDEILSRGVSGVPPHSDGSHSGYVADQVEKMMHSGTKASVSEFIPTEFHRMLEDIAAGKPLDEAFAHVSTAQFHISSYRIRDILAAMMYGQSPDEGPMADHLRNNPGNWGPRGPDASATASADHPPSPSSGGGGGFGSGGGGGGPTPSAEVTEIVDSVSKENYERYQDARVSDSQVEGLAEYDDFFPRSVASANNTILAQELSRHASDVAGVAEDVAFRVERAGSFAMLQGFSRVGGVLIGREPDNPQQRLDLRGFDWKIQGRNVWLSIRDANGAVTTIGPFDKSLVHQALAYAADGRPVAVTMTTARPMQILKVQLHPALVDTPLGCRVSQVDRLVDTFTSRGKLPDRGKEEAALKLQLAVYKYAWAARLSTLGTLVQQHPEIETALNQSLKKVDALKQGLAEPSLLTADGVMRRKPAFFDPDLVHAIEACRDGGANAFAECVKHRFSDVTETATVRREWIEGPTDFIPWSGVRERPYRLSEDLSFLRPPAGTGPAARLWPFDFLVQISFTTAAVNAPGGNEQYVDKEPLELADLRSRIQELVDAGIRDSGLAPSLEDLRNFVILQRLFRAALNNSLGDQFPVTRLAALEHDTAGDIPYLHTARWQGSLVPLMIADGAPATEVQEQMKLEDAFGVTADVRKMRQQESAGAPSREGERPCPPLVSRPALGSQNYASN